MYSTIAHSCTNNTVVAGYHDSRRNTDTPYRSLWRYICSSCARAGVFPGTCWYTGLPVCPVYRFFLVLPLQAGKSGHRLYISPGLVNTLEFFEENYDTHARKTVQGTVSLFPGVIQSWSMRTLNEEPSTVAHHWPRTTSPSMSSEGCNLRVLFRRNHKKIEYRFT